MKGTPLRIAGAATLLIGSVCARFDLAGIALKEVPSCANACFLAGATQIGCGIADYACQCHQEATLYAVVEECVATACEASMYQNVIDGRSLVCKRALAETGGGTVTVSGSMTVIISGTVGSGTVAPLSTLTATTTGSGGPGTTSISSTASTTVAGGGSGGSSPTTSSPSYYASSSVISGSERRGPPSPWLLAAVAGFGVALACL